MDGRSLKVFYHAPYNIEVLDKMCDRANTADVAFGTTTWTAKGSKIFDIRLYKYRSIQESLFKGEILIDTDILSLELLRIDC